MIPSLFITGTDTDVGKTYVSGLILNALNAMGLKSFALKPIASGCEADSTGQLKSPDALYLQHHSSLKKPYEIVNPIAFENPVAPHIAAAETQTLLTKSRMCEIIASTLPADADVHLIEGAGGWMIPLNQKELFCEVILELQIPIILVVGIKLGCLNHALLTHQNIIAKGGNFRGWIANCIDPKALSITANIETLKQWIPEPCLGVVPYGCKSTAVLDTALIYP